ncbi:hypothetical protein EDI_308830 [Entamoeba dispar SAW760]|uniref:Calcium-regulated actin-bundling protein C-terminal domain-containing protein n=1 Tax=Entamoeba dispar (strain ATCC PRA-260 / SAW760) TaxID=370354 RepID=B0EP12_ENTDS|nr:uncharacterized protein EDI_308830 [Entamoeba dispar SAW760]EDR23751.1 hypothetical protein EDI_308830 [Entamoeba dispar SAW760]|eukprot:EDR23751.1 hypothetical protein EDI_308830 [Entamoeba dispar SAW760]
MSQYAQQYKELAEKKVEEQAKAFLTQFVLEFQGKFDEVLDTATSFKGYTDGTVETLEEDAMHVFMEKRGETTTIQDLRERLKTNGIEFRKRFAFIDYMMFEYCKNIKDLFEKRGGAATPEMLKALDDALAEFQKVMDIKNARLQKMKKLESDAAKGGVKGMAAQNELAQMKSEDQLALNKMEVTAAAKKRKAQKAVENGDDSKAREKALKEENARLEAEKKKKEEEEKRKREESRRRLAERAAKFNQA